MNEKHLRKPSIKTVENCSDGAAEKGEAACEPLQDGASEILRNDALVYARDSFFGTHDWKQRNRTSENEKLTTYKGMNHPLLRRYRDLQQKQKS